MMYLDFFLMEKVLDAEKGRQGQKVRTSKVGTWLTKLGLATHFIGPAKVRFRHPSN